MRVPSVQEEAYMKSRIIVFGRGWYYQNKREQLKKDYEIVGFLDNNVAVGHVEEEMGG